MLSRQISRNEFPAAFWHLHGLTKPSNSFFIKTPGIYALFQFCRRQLVYSDGLLSLRYIPTMFDVSPKEKKIAKSGDLGGHSKAP